MPSFPSTVLDADTVKMRFREPSVPAALNLRSMGFPRGVYRGFTPSVTSGSLVLSLTVDPVLGFSNLKVGARTTKGQIDVYTTETVTLDFTGHTVFPVFVLARADYAESTPTQGRIFTRVVGPEGPQEIAICLVDRPANDLVVTTDIPGRRQPPLAFDGQAFGYMYRGAPDDIIFAQSATAEVITARDDLKNPGPPPPGQRLADRCAIDFAADFLADQLGLQQIAMAGNARILSAGAGTGNFSGSFSERHREIKPTLTIEPGGNETTEGAVVDPDDRALCFLIDDTTGQRLITAARHPIYGRLEFSTAALTGTMSFVQAATTVTGVGTLFTTELQVGDTILGADGTYYEVSAIASNFSLTLSIAYQSATAMGVASSYRRWLVRFYTRESGAELATTLVSNTKVRVFFSSWWRTDRAIFDGSALMKRTGERPELPQATSVLRGRIKVAASGGKAAAIHTISQAGTPISGGPNYHTLNFTGTNAVVTNAGGGVANIVVPGEPGPSGPGATPGPQGPTGSPGPGANVLNPFEKSGALGPGGTHSFSVDFSGATPPLPSPLIHSVCGIARYEAVSWGTPDQFEITFHNKTGTTATMGINLDGPGGASTAVAKGFLGASI